MCCQRTPRLSLSCLRDEGGADTSSAELEGHRKCVEEGKVSAVGGGEEPPIVGTCHHSGDAFQEVASNSRPPLYLYYMVCRVIVIRVGWNGILLLTRLSSCHSIFAVMRDSVKLPAWAHTSYVWSSFHVFHVFRVCLFCPLCGRALCFVARIIIAWLSPVASRFTNASRKINILSTIQLYKLYNLCNEVIFLYCCVIYCLIFLFYLTSICFILKWTPSFAWGKFCHSEKDECRYLDNRYMMLTVISYIVQLCRRVFSIVFVWNS